MAIINQSTIESLATHELADKWAEFFDAADDRPEISRLLGNFKSFSADYFHFISESVDTSELTALQHDLYRATMRLQHEWATIAYLVLQHTNPELRPRLDEISSQAVALYESFLGSRLAVTPIIYFEKVFGVTRFVFTPYPVISVPFRYFKDTGISETMIRSALAHEIGHYLFWNLSGPWESNVSRQELERVVLHKLLNAYPIENYPAFRQVSDLADVWMSWLEETFADICGVLLAGEQFVRTAQQRAIEETNLDAQELITDDKEHPGHYFRPLISIAVIQWIARHITDPDQREKLENHVRQLSETWLSQADAEKLDHGAHPSGLPVVLIKNSIQQVVDAILENPYQSESWSQYVKNQSGVIRAPVWGDQFKYHDWLKTDFDIEITPHFVRGLSDADPIQPDVEDFTFEALRQQLLSRNKKTEFDAMLLDQLLAMGLEDYGPLGGCNSAGYKWVGDGNGTYVFQGNWYIWSLNGDWQPCF